VNDKTTVLIVDDQRLFADGLRVVIESRAPQFRVIGIAGNGKEAIAAIRGNQPDIVLMDVRMPEMDGVEATKIIHDRYPQIKILILTTFSDDEYVTHSLRNGAIGYLLKNRPAEELIDSIRALAKGILQIDPAVSAKLLNTTHSDRQRDEEFLERLRTISSRERQILELMVQAKRIAAIAEELGIAAQTVRNHIANIYMKLGIHDRLEIVNYIGPIREYLKNAGS
jgi:DNA-binding NarL/FixJ family response regulator